MGEESKPSDKIFTGHFQWRSFFNDLLVAVGVVGVAAGGYLFHPGIGCILLGLAFILIGTRGSISGGSDGTDSTGA